MMKIIINKPVNVVRNEAHKTPCAKCPSAHYPPDAEVLDIKQMTKDIRISTAFPCAWSPVKYCKGYCDFMGITDADLKSPHNGYET
jgi:hypothetical protein